MSTHNIGFYEDLTKIIFKLSSNTHLISSAVIDLKFWSQFGLYRPLRRCPVKFKQNYNNFPSLFYPGL